MLYAIWHWPYFHWWKTDSFVTNCYIQVHFLTNVEAMSIIFNVMLKDKMCLIDLIVRSTFCLAQSTFVSQEFQYAGEDISLFTIVSMSKVKLKQESYSYQHIWIMESCHLHIKMSVIQNSYTECSSRYFIHTHLMRHFKKG